MAKKAFRAPVSSTLKITEDGDVFGTIRVKPSTVMWKPRGAKGAKPWFGISIERFEKFITKKGSRMDQ